MAKEYTYKVYVTDTDGSERLGTVVVASTKEAAIRIAKVRGCKNISSVERQ